MLNSDANQVFLHLAGPRSVSHMYVKGDTLGHLYLPHRMDGVISNILLQASSLHTSVLCQHDFHAANFPESLDARLPTERPSRGGEG